MVEKNKKVVLFDGVCNLCNFWVDLLISLDKSQELHFASLQSDFGQRVLTENGLSNQSFDSFLFLDGHVLFQKSTAAIKVFTTLGGLWRLLRILLLVPKAVRDFVYSFIARNRYRFFGKRDSCRLPTEEERSRFLI